MTDITEFATEPQKRSKTR